MSDQAAAALPSSDALASAVDTPTEDQALGAIFDKLVTQNGADRGDDGKFASSNGEAKEPAQGDPAAGAEQQPAPVVTAAPAHLPQTLKAQWDKIPEEARAEVAKLTGDWDRKFGEQGKQMQPMKQVYDRLNEAISKHPDFKGLTPDDLGKGAARLAAVQVAFTKNPVNTLVELANSAGVRQQLAQALGLKVEGQPADQNQSLINGLVQKISNLEAQIKGASDPEKVRETVSMTLKERETGTLVEQFQANEGKDYWADVEADIPDFIKIVMGKGQATDPKGILQAAYEMAINANPEVRAKVRAAEAKATAAGGDPKRAESARKAASINVKSSANGKDRVMTEEEALSAAYDRSMQATH